MRLGTIRNNVDGVGRNFGWLVLFGCLMPAIAMAAAPPAQVKVVVSGDLSGTLTQFLEPNVAVADASKNVEGLNLTILTGPFLGDVAVYVPKDSDPGTYQVRGETQQSDNPGTASLTCAKLMGDNSGQTCASYTGDADGSITLTEVGKTWSGSFDVTAKTVDGNHQIHMTGNFSNVPVNTKVD